jgi:hypothetical protein
VINDFDDFVEGRMKTRWGSFKALQCIAKGGNVGKNSEELLEHLDLTVNQLKHLKTLRTVVLKYRKDVFGVKTLKSALSMKSIQCFKHSQYRKRFIFEVFQCFLTNTNVSVLFQPFFTRTPL